MPDEPKPLTHAEVDAIEVCRSAAEKEITLPLVVVERAPDGDDGWVDEIDDADGDRVVETDCGVYPPARATAHYLVAAANSVPRLVAALRQAWATLDGIAKTPELRAALTEHGGDLAGMAASIGWLPPTEPPEWAKEREAEARGRVRQRSPTLDAVTMGTVL